MWISPHYGGFLEALHLCRHEPLALPLLQHHEDEDALHRPITPALRLTARGRGTPDCVNNVMCRSNFPLNS